jgi:hypothetical protein
VNYFSSSPVDIREIDSTLTMRLSPTQVQNKGTYNGLIFLSWSNVPLPSFQTTRVRSPYPYKKEESSTKKIQIIVKGKEDPNEEKIG